MSKSHKNTHRHKSETIFLGCPATNRRKALIKLDLTPHKLGILRRSVRSTRYP
ncbi:MAG: hypothetical protein ACJAV1_001822 [Paraglaciecola sp.]|jgi:hypothetical protein